MKAIVAQAIAEARNGQGKGLAKVHLIVYGNMEEEKVRRLFEEASQGTQAEGVALSVQKALSRFICWNCCGLRFESMDGVCPNCGEVALEVPDEISFALREVEVVP
jgi:Zn finger protein HypA/HybF involved in hydrogenase expression